MLDIGALVHYMRLMSDAGLVSVNQYSVDRLRQVILLARAGCHEGFRQNSCAGNIKHSFGYLATLQASR